MKIDSETLLVELLTASNALWAASRPFFTPFGITEAHFNVLNLLAQVTTPISQRELSDQLLTDKSAVTGLVDRMEKKQLIRRKEAPHDRRVYHLQITPKGLALWKKIRPLYINQIEQLFTGMTPSQRDEFHQRLLTIKNLALKRAQSQQHA
jgi:DNA-binding MarR family transcriptional regulator